MKILRIVTYVSFLTLALAAVRADVRTYRFTGTRIGGTGEFGDTLSGTVTVDTAFALFPRKLSWMQYVWNASGTSDISVQTSSGAVHADGCALLSADDEGSESQYVNSTHYLGYGWNYSTFVSIRFLSFGSDYSGDGIPDFPDPLP